MLKGPKLNSYNPNLTRRDNLGINAVYASITSDLCPIINNVTPRAFYWVFLAWIYYDFYKNYHSEKIKREDFSHYLKRQDFFFIMSSVLNGNDIVNMNGIDKIRQIINNNPDAEQYQFDITYFKSFYGGMNYFNAGLLTMKIITEYDEENRPLPFPKITQYGKEMGEYFEEIIKDTEYYKKYRRSSEIVPKHVLIEYGEKINMGLIGFDKCKDLLIQLFEKQEENKKLIETFDYLNFLNNNNYISGPDENKIREIFYEYFSCRGKNLPIDENLKEISIGWEIAIIRQYFTLGFEYIWNYMLEILAEKPMNQKEWIDKVISKSEFEDFNIEDNVEQYFGRFELDFNELENIYSISRKNKINNLNNGLKVMLAMIDRIKNREDINEYNKKFLYTGGEKSISFEYFYNQLQEYKNKSVRELLYFIMEELLINQHYNTAYEKMLAGRNGFYFEVDEGLYIQKEYSDFAKQGIRATQAYKVARDLHIIKE